MFYMYYRKYVLREICTTGNMYYREKCTTGNMYYMEICTTGNMNYREICTKENMYYREICSTENMYYRIEPTLLKEALQNQVSYITAVGCLCKLYQSLSFNLQSQQNNNSSFIAV